MALADYLVPVASQSNICFDCKKACGGCSWSEVDPDTGKVRFEPVPGWTAEKTYMLVCPRGGQRKWVETFRITACPEFDLDDERRPDNRMLTETESQDFLKNIQKILRRWNTDG